MATSVLMKSIQEKYVQGINKLLETEKKLTPDNIITLSEKLYANFKVRGISVEETKENDMLLFQYGTYDWGDELGEHFSFDITRQFYKKNGDIYQLSLTLIFDPINFKELNPYNKWSSYFQSIGEWATHIKTTQGYHLSKSQPIQSYELTMDRV
ncbi:hypothetical protein OOZ15_03915 [Galbibacter sp. EGI 63066]|uniref:hypothetical protein n=1 Tax=Galbibacter sp. EGI 63066 TaxID=2993559 RepID=UPI0022489E94|nr:hypothetical protein [Galbibacter sp. EGI 63066]MCX2679078.1 hypothetical protein [Galbibacter sp. EGI 63066]